MLCTKPDECRLFHVISDQNLALIRIFNAMNDMGVRIRYVEPEEFEKAFDKAKNTVTIVILCILPACA